MEFDSTQTRLAPQIFVVRLRNRNFLGRAALVPSHTDSRWWERNNNPRIGRRHNNRDHSGFVLSTRRDCNRIIPAHKCDCRALPARSACLLTRERGSGWRAVFDHFSAGNVWHFLVEFFHAVPIALLAPVKRADIHWSLQNKSTLKKVCAHKLRNSGWKLP